MLVADAQLADRADHAVGDVAVGLARGDREAARAAPRRAARRRRGRRRRSCARRRRCRAARLSPTSTWHQRIVLPFFCGSSAKDSTRPTTIGPASPSAPDSTRSTSRPTRTSASAELARRERRRAARRCSASHADAARRASGLHPERRGEPDVALDDVAHVGGVVAEHQRCARCPCRTRSRCSARGRCRRRSSTRGLTMPQPPHSIQPSLLQVRQGRSGLPTDSPRQTKQTQVHLGARLGEREVGRAQPGDDARRRTSPRPCGRACP